MEEKINARIAVFKARSEDYTISVTILDSTVIRGVPNNNFFNMNLIQARTQIKIRRKFCR